MSKKIFIKNIAIGGGSKITVQTMTNTDTANGVLLLEQIKALEECGADIIRATVNTQQAVKGFAYAASHTTVPLVADIHFDYRLAMLAAEAGAAKIRINPSNIGSQQNLAELCACLKDKNIPIRVGVNGGSLDKSILEKYGNTAQALAESALKHVLLLENMSFENIVISVKSSSVTQTIQACKILNKKTDYPLHLGVTETGGGRFALTKSAIGIGSLLLDGIGDTIRVSLSEDPKNEVYAGHDILRAIGLETNYVNIISCPTCGRTEYDVINVSARLREAVKNIKVPVTIAVMGCVVNGIGESKNADFGVAGGKNKSAIFEKGEKIAIVNNDEVESFLLALLEKYTQKYRRE